MGNRKESSPWAAANWRHKLTPDTQAITGEKCGAMLGIGWAKQIGKTLSRYYRRPQMHQQRGIGLHPVAPLPETGSRADGDKLSRQVGTSGGETS